MEQNRKELDELKELDDELKETSEIEEEESKQLFEQEMDYSSDLL